MKTQSRVKKMTLIAILGALAAIMMFIKTPLPFMPPFMDFDLASLPEIIGGFALGPLAAIAIIIIKIIIKLALLGTSTAFTGEIQNVMVSLAYVLPAVFIYQKCKNKKSAVHGMIMGILSCVVVATLTNVYMIIPLYAKLYFGASTQTIVDMCHAVLPIIDNMWTMVVFGIVPFNIIKFGVTSIVTYIIYKKMSHIMKNFIQN